MNNAQKSLNLLLADASFGLQDALGSLQLSNPEYATVKLDENMPRNECLEYQM